MPAALPLAWRALCRAARRARRAWQLQRLRRRIAQMRVAMAGPTLMLHTDHPTRASWEQRLCALYAELHRIEEEQAHDC